MAEYRNASRLQYVDADNIDDDRVDFDGLDVLDTAGNKLGDVDGFVVQADTKRPYYVVVDSGGWFSSRTFLVPIGHARLDAGNKALRVDLDKPTLQRFPEFDKDRFPEMSEEQSRLFTERTLTACCGDELRQRTGADRYDYDKWSHYNQPDWWQPSWFGGSHDRGVERTSRLGATEYTDYTVPPASVPSPSREEVIARDRSLRENDIDVVRDDDADIRDERIVSDSPLDRAQPGDVLGIENAGETTNLGDSARDERKRLADVEEDAADLRRDELKDRNKDRR